MLSVTDYAERSNNNKAYQRANFVVFRQRMTTTITF